MTNLQAIADHFHLGTVRGQPAERHGGVNRLWRLETERGAFAVHERLGIPIGVDPLERCDRVHELEHGAAASGVRIATPIVDPGSERAAAFVAGFDRPIVVHEWVDADAVHVDRTRAETYRQLGTSLARIHTLHDLNGSTDVDPAAHDGLDRRPTAEDWREIARRAEGEWPWSATIEEAADELAAAITTVDGWEQRAAEPTVLSHRDLTSQNILDDHGEPVLIDWEDAGPIGPGNEIGRTALDNLGRDGRLDHEKLRAYLAGYATTKPLPPLGPHWCSLWVRGLVIFADHCARSCLAGTTASKLPTLRAQQSQVVQSTPDELRRRLRLVDDLLEQFDAAAPTR